MNVGCIGVRAGAQGLSNVDATAIAALGSSSPTNDYGEDPGAVMHTGSLTPYDTYNSVTVSSS